MKNVTYIGTRDKNIRYKASEAILKGICPDGGLFIPEEMPVMEKSIEELAEMDYRNLAYEVMSLFFTDFTEDELRYCINNAYDSKFDTDKIAPVVEKDGVYFLELFHGKTIAFKDMALSILPYLMKTSAKKNNIDKEIVILTATSGDTGKAALEGFADVEGTRIIVFYPDGGVSPVQRMQMVTQKGKNVKENIYRNFGMASPEGYRKALRLMKQAEKFGRPVVTFVDTPGAACGIEAEERGQGEAIARNLLEMSGIQTPMVSILIGEGGSGGALGLAVTDEVWMMENATYSILSPEGFASILWKDGKRAKEASEVMKITAKDLKKLQIIEKVIREPEPANEENLPEIAEEIREDLDGFLRKSCQKTREQIVEERYERFRRM